MSIQGILLPLELNTAACCINPITTCSISYNNCYQQSQNSSKHLNSHSGYINCTTKQLFIEKKRAEPILSLFPLDLCFNWLHSHHLYLQRTLCRTDKYRFHTENTVLGDTLCTNWLGRTPLTATLVKILSYLSIVLATRQK